MSAITLYPCSISVTGHPANRGIADLALTLAVDVNSTSDYHIVCTAEQLVKIRDDITRKLDGVHLVALENSRSGY